MLADITPSSVFLFLYLFDFQKKIGGTQHVTPLKINFSTTPPPPPPRKYLNPSRKNVTPLKLVNRYHHFPPHPFFIFFVPFLHFSPKNNFRGEELLNPLIRPCCQLTMIVKNSTHVLFHIVYHFLYFCVLPFFKGGPPQCHTSTFKNLIIIIYR